MKPWLVIVVEEGDLRNRAAGPGLYAERALRLSRWIRTWGKGKYLVETEETAGDAIVRLLANLGPNERGTIVFISQVHAPVAEGLAKAYGERANLFVWSGGMSGREPSRAAPHNPRIAFAGEVLPDNLDAFIR